MRRTALKVALWLIAANAALAVVILLGGDMGDTQAKILGTSLLATMGAVIALVCAPAASAGRMPPIPQVGIGAAVLASAIFVFAIWAESGEVIFKSGGTALVIALGSALASLLSSWPGGSRDWVRAAANTLTALASAMVIVGMWAEFDEEIYWRLFGVVCVLLAAAAIATPVVHRMEGPPVTVAITHCPICGSPVEGTASQLIDCPNGHRFSVVV